MGPIKFALLTVSDSCHKNERINTSETVVESFINDGKIAKNCESQICCKDVIPDDEYLIKEKLISWADNEKMDVILTIGGTGFSERDVTPEATKQVINKEAPGMTLAMITSSLKITPMAMLSRAVCGIRNKTLIINLPGSPKAATECLSVIACTIPHAVDLIKDNRVEIKEVHENSCLHKGSDVKLECLKKIAQRPRKSPYIMVSVKDALEMIYKCSEVLESEQVNIKDAYGRILTADLYSKYDLPPFRASIKDGYAVIATDGKGRRKVLGGITAGSMAANDILVPGTCIRVNTGAPIPDEATAVVQVEDTILLQKAIDNIDEKEIEILTEVKHGQDIRPVGSDIQKGQLILKSGMKLQGIELGLATAGGYNEVSVVKVPCIGVLSTGNELQCSGSPLNPGCIYDTNKITLMSLLKEYGLDSVDIGIARDNEVILVQKIQHALEIVDVLITSGSVSMGDGDMLKPILQHHFDATIHFGRVNMKPGKPTTFATCFFNNRKKYILCLPGNPVSATVTMVLFALPLLKQLCGNCVKPIIIKAKLTSSYNLDERPEYARAILKWDDTDILPKAYGTGNQISSKLLSCKNANALLMLPARTAEKATAREGETIQAMLLGFEGCD